MLKLSADRKGDITRNAQHENNFFVTISSFQVIVSRNFWFHLSPSLTHQDIGVVNCEVKFEGTIFF